MSNTAHNFGKPLGYAVVADCPEYPKQDGMLCGGVHTFKDDAHKAARDPAMGSVRIVPLGPFVPQGFVLVPAEPTGAMLSASLRLGNQPETTRATWAAMLAAAPDTSAVPVSVDGKQVSVAPGTDVLNIKAAADIPGIYMLVQERLGLPDLQHGDADVPELKGGEVFYSVPPTNNG